MARAAKTLTLGNLLKERRQQLGLSRAQVAERVDCRPNHIAYLEVDQRRPSDALVKRLAKALDLDAAELFFMANPEARALVAPQQATRGSTWEKFKANKALHTRHAISKSEIAALEGVALLGAVRTQRDFLFILQTIRQALADE